MLVRNVFLFFILCARHNIDRIKAPQIIFNLVLKLAAEYPSGAERKVERGQLRVRAAFLFLLLLHEIIFIRLYCPKYYLIWFVIKITGRTSEVFLAEIPLRSPRKLFIFMI